MQPIYRGNSFPRRHLKLEHFLEHFTVVEPRYSTENIPPFSWQTDAIRSDNIIHVRVSVKSVILCRNSNKFVGGIGREFINYTYKYLFFFLSNLMLPACWPNFAEFACTTYQIVQTCFTICDILVQEDLRSALYSWSFLTIILSECFIWLSF